MPADEDPEPPDPSPTGDGPSTRGLLTLAAIGVVIWIAAPLITRWYQCQQLAPIERLFVSGC